MRKQIILERDPWLAHRSRMPSPMGASRSSERMDECGCANMYPEATLRGIAASTTET